MSFPPPPAVITLSGRSTGQGALTARALNTRFVTLSGRSTGSGSIAVTTSSVAGAFRDFALVPYVAASPYADPRQTHVTAFVPRKDTYPVSTWERISITASAPEVIGLFGATNSATGALYPTPAAYARVGIVSDAVPGGTFQQLAAAQFERTPAGRSTTTPEAGGSNILGLDEASGEDQVLYLADRIGATVKRSSEMSVTGSYSYKYQWALPPAVNSYSRVTYFQQFGTLKQLRANYTDTSARAYTKGEVPSPAEPSGTTTTSGGPTSFTFSPTGAALDRVVAGVAYQCSLWAAAEIVGLTAQCQLLVYDAGYNLIQTITSATSGASGVTATLSTARKFFKTRLATPPLVTGATWASLVPVVSSGSTPWDELAFWADEMRVWSLSTTAPAAATTSPARAWQPPRQFTIQLKANRINLCENPRLRNGASLTATGNVTRMAPYIPPGAPSFIFDAITVNGFDGGVSGRFQIPDTAISTLSAAGSQGYIGVTSTSGTDAFIQGLSPSSVFTVSCWIKRTAGPYPITIWAYDGANWVQGSSTSWRQNSALPPPERISVTVRTGPDFPGSTVIRIGHSARDIGIGATPHVPGPGSFWWRPTTLPAATGAWNTTTLYQGSSQIANSSVVSYLGSNWECIYTHGARTTTGACNSYVSGILAENGTDQVGSYFDGSTNSLDYMWEVATLPYACRSHYYRGKGVNQTRLDQAIKDALPVGATYQVLYAPMP